MIGEAVLAAHFPAEAGDYLQGTLTSPPDGQATYATIDRARHQPMDVWPSKLPHTSDPAPAQVSHELAGALTWS